MGVTAPSATVGVVAFAGGAVSVVPVLWGDTLVTYFVAVGTNASSRSIVVPVTVGVVAGADVIGAVSFTLMAMLVSSFS